MCPQFGNIARRDRRRAWVHRHWTQFGSRDASHVAYEAPDRRDDFRFSAATPLGASAHTHDFLVPCSAMDPVAQTRTLAACGGGGQAGIPGLAPPKGSPAMCQRTTVAKKSQTITGKTSALPSSAGKRCHGIRDPGSGQTITAMPTSQPEKVIDERKTVSPSALRRVSQVSASCCHCLISCGGGLDLGVAGYLYFSFDRLQSEVPPAKAASTAGKDKKASSRSRSREKGKGKDADSKPAVAKAPGVKGKDSSRSRSKSSKSRSRARRKRSRSGGIFFRPSSMVSALDHTSYDYGVCFCDDSNHFLFVRLIVKRLLFVEETPVARPVGEPSRMFQTRCIEGRGAHSCI